MGQSRKSKRRTGKRDQPSLLHDPAKLIAKRGEVNKTQTQLAEAADLTQQLISHLEVGRCSASLDSLRRIASALGCEIWDLIAEDSDLLRRAS